MALRQSVIPELETQCGPGPLSLPTEATVLLCPSLGLHLRQKELLGVFGLQKAAPQGRVKETVLFYDEWHLYAEYLSL